MRSFAIGLVCGIFVGIVVLLIAREIFPAEHEGKVSSNTPVVAPVESRAAPVGDPAEFAKKLEGATDKALAEALEGAQFDRSWVRVEGVSRALRSRPAAPKTDPMAGLANEAIVGPRAKPAPLVALELEVARRRLVLELRSHDNAAVRLLDKASDEESVKQLAELFQAEGKRPDFEPVRADAALVLALGATERGREVLVRAVREGPPERGLLAAHALGLSEDEKAFAILVELLAKDLDAEVRKRAAQGLGTSSAVARPASETISVLTKTARFDNDESVRVLAIGALQNADLVRAEKARAVLVELLGAPSEPPAVRLASIATVRAHRAVAGTTTVDVTEALLQLVTNERDGPIRAAAAEALIDIAPPSSAATLEAALRNAQDPAVRDFVQRAVLAAKSRGEPPP